MAPVDDAKVSEFIDNLDRVNALAERSDGFLWRLEGASGNATEFIINNDPRFISNLSLWRDIASLHFFVFNTLHKAFYKRRAEWFEKPATPHFAMWFVEEGEKPSLEDGLARLKTLQKLGESERAFTWKSVQGNEFVLKRENIENI